MRMEILCGETFFRMSMEQYVTTQMAPLAWKVGVSIPPPSCTSERLPLLARVNNNRWIVDCPTCGGAEFAWLQSRLFMCQTCWNNATRNQWVRVAFPVDQEQIAAVLIMRPNPNNRNWELAETVADLRKENLAAGLPGGI